MLGRHEGVEVTLLSESEPGTAGPRRTSAISSALLVVLRPSGLSVPAIDGRPPISLELPHLMTLDRLARGGPVRGAVAEVADRTATDPAALHDFVAQLDQLGYLTDEATAARPAFAARAEAPPNSMRAGPARRLIALTPLVLWVTPDGFISVDHDRRFRAALGPVGLSALAGFAQPRTWLEGLTAHRRTCGPHALTEPAFEELIDRLGAVGLIGPVAESDAVVVTPQDRAQALADARVANAVRVKVATERRLAERDELRAESGTPTDTRVPVYPIQHNDGSPPLGLGMVMSYAGGLEGGVLGRSFDLRPDWIAAQRDASELAGRPGVFLFSNYVWSHAANLEVSRAFKAAEPRHVTVHGGPDSPKYPGDVERYFAVHPHIDVVVHGEGEVTAAELLRALAGSFGDDPTDLEPLRSVPGLSFRLGRDVIRTPDRDRLADLDVIPSPFLTGLFDAYGDARASGAVVETNRGCPYGCTFCDWGSSTMSRIRKFDLDRVFAELEWCARHEVRTLGIADANFGIFERDVAIAEKLAELKGRYGYPISCYASFAKNTTKHLRKIVETWVGAEILTHGLLALQSTDPGILDAVHRKNIKLEKYHDLADEFRAARLPLLVDLMMGLPGSTTATFHNDLQHCVDREVVAKIHVTTLLPNSPMNEPEYRQAHDLQVAEPREVGRGNPFSQIVVSSATFTRADFEQWQDLRRVFLMCENFGVLRQVSRFVRQETGVREVDLLDRMRTDARSEPERWPLLSFLVRAGPDLLAPPMSWGSLLDEVRSYLVQQMGIADDDALDTVLTVQHALLPASERRFPLEVALPHDYAAWYAAMMDAKSAAADWVATTPRLASFGPGRLVVDDPQGVSRAGLGYGIENGWNDSWEMASDVSRPIPARPADL